MVPTIQEEMVKMEVAEKQVAAADVDDAVVKELWEKYALYSQNSLFFSIFDN